MNPTTPDVKSLFGQALEIAAPVERAAFLDRACADNPALRVEVESLLLAHGRADDFLQQPASPLPNTIDHLPPTEGVGAVIGPYKLLQQIGEGGMGVVFMAEQTQPVRRMVALKIIKLGMDSAHVLARFEAERQALALMDHPHIARVLEAGATETGRPYFVMELVKGVPITQFCDDHQLTPRERLELFVPVCQAVQHAHTKGVIHRDLKPSNVLVALYDDKPVPKVIDFGIAKAAGQRLTDRTLFTEFGTVVGTLEYMSPEQATLNALDVDTRSDVYSLGVLLYELLTGVTPLDKARLKQAAFDEVLRLIREEEPLRPSTRLSQSGEALATISARRRTEPTRLSQVVRGELDWIVLKALAKDRVRRYETANAFAADLQRYLGDEPVEARPPSTLYRLGKFARRNRTALTTAVLVSLALVVGTIVSTWQAIRATWAEAEAVRKEAAASLAEQQARDDAEFARRQRDEAQAARERERRTLYGAEMNLAQAAWQADNIGRVFDLLEKQRPKEGESDLRGFEWHYWDRLSHADLLTVQLPRMPSDLWSSALSPDGTRLALVGLPPAGESGSLSLEVWDTATGRKRCHYLPEFDGGAVLSNPSFNADGKWVAIVAGFHPQGAAPRTSEVKVWEVATGRLHASIPVPAPRHSFSHGMSPDGSRIVVSHSGELQVWEVASGKRLSSHQLTLRAPFHAMATFSPDGTRIVVGMPEQPNDPTAMARRRDSAPTKVTVWEVGTGKEIISFSVPPGRLNYPRFSPDGRDLVTHRYPNDAPGVIEVWDAATGKKKTEFPSGLSSDMWRLFSLTPFALSPDGGRIAVPADKTIHVRDMRTGTHLLTFRGHSGTIGDIAFSKDGTRLYSTGAEGTLKVWDTTPKPVPPTQPDPEIGPRVRRLARTVTPDGKRFAVSPLRAFGEPQPEIRVQDASGKVLRTFPGERVFAIALSGDGSRLAALLSPTHSRLVVWEVATGREILSVDKLVPRELSLPPPRLVINHDGTRVLCSNRATADHRLFIWDVDTGQQLFDFQGSFYGEAAFSPSGQMLVWHQGNHLRVLDPSSEGNSRILAETNGSPTCLVFSADGRLLASGNMVDQFGSGKHNVQVFDTETGREVLLLRGLPTFPRAMVFSPDGRRLATLMDGLYGLSGRLVLWDTTTAQDLLDVPVASSNPGGLAFSADGNRLMLGLPSTPEFQVIDATPR